MATETLVHGNLVLRDHVMTGTIIIRGDKIVEIRKEDTPTVPESAQLINATGKFVLPGAIEVHGHMREPGDAHKEDYTTGTMAALAGGVTTILDMPNTRPPTTTRALLDQKLEHAAQRSFCDFGMIFGGSSDNIDELRAVDPRLIVGVKFFMAGHETTPTTVADLGDLYHAFEILGKRNLIALVHAENQQLLKYLSSKAMSDPHADGLAYSRARDEVVVTVATQEAIQIAQSTGTRLYLCHLSTIGELDALRCAKARHQPVYGELAWYHLVFNTDDYARLGTRLKVSPALRSPHHQAALWHTLLHDNLIDTLCSEHSPHLLSEKATTFSLAASGMPGIQEYRAIVLTKLIEQFALEPAGAVVKVADLTSTRIAEIFGLKKKGELRSGKDADLAIVDLNRQVELRQTDLLTKGGWSTYEDQPIRGRPDVTMLRGKIVYSDGKIVGPPTGRFVG